jgi:hypothetical protein
VVRFTLNALFSFNFGLLAIASAGRIALNLRERQSHGVRIEIAQRRTRYYVLNNPYYACVGFNHEIDSSFQRRSLALAMRRMDTYRRKCWIKAVETLAGRTSPGLQQR